MVAVAAGLRIAGGWGRVFFRAETLPAALGYLAAMFGFNPDIPAAQMPFVHVEPDVRLAIAAGIVFSAPVFQPLRRRVDTLAVASRMKAAGFLAGSIGMVRTMALVVLLYASVLYLASGAYNPFIYFRF